MTCKEAAYRASDYFEGALSHSEVAEIDAHLASCARCRTYFEQTRQLIDAMHRLPRSYSYSPRTRSQIMADFETHHSVPRVFGIRRSWVFVAAGIMTVAALAVLVWIAQIRNERPAVLQAVTLDLTARGPVRGPEEGPPKPPLEIPRGNLDLTIYLPFGSEPGIYDLQIVRERGKPPIWSSEAEARLENYKTTVHLKVDAHRWKSGAYSIGISAKGWPWTYFPVVLRSQK